MFLYTTPTQNNTHTHTHRKVIRQLTIQCIHALELKLWSVVV